MLGLQERQDAGLVDAPDTTAPEAMVDAGCKPSGFAGDNFDAPALDTGTWSVQGTLPASQSNGKLHIDLTPGTVFKIGDVRTFGMISRNEVITARLAMGPSVSNTSTALMLESTPGTSIYRFAVVNNASVGPPSVVMQDPGGGSSFGYDSGEHQLFRLRHDGTDVVFETSADGELFMERKRVMGTAHARFYVLIQAIMVSASSTSRVSWDDVTVECQ